MKAKTKEEIEALPIPEWISAPYSIALAFLESAEFPYDRDKRYVLACLRQLADVHENPDERQVGGDHYKTGSHEHWNVMQEWLGEDGYMGYMTGVIIKYLMRWPMKGGVDDLQKARHCLEKLISYMAEREEKPS